MYSPKLFSDVSDNKILQFINDYPLATLVVKHSGTIEINHLPLQLNKNDNNLYGHIAKANSLATILLDHSCDVTVIFHGSHGYISPRYYFDKKDSAPTWNYAVVHVDGKMSLVDDELLTIILDNQFTHYESSEIDWSNPSILAKLRGICGIKIEIRKINAKFKLSQNKSLDDQHSIINNLNQSSCSGDHDLAKFMGLHLKDNL